MKQKRNTYKIFMNVSESTASKEWEIIGKDIEELSRELNNEVNSITNILGETSTEVTKGNQVTTCDPIKLRDDSKASKILYNIYKNDLELSEVEKEFLEVNTSMPVSGSEVEFEAFTQVGAIDLKSWGGDTTGINSPFDINWIGAKTFGTFNPTTKTFTPAE